MAEFCKQCAEQLCGTSDVRSDFSFDKKPDPGTGYPVLCEGCGFILVDEVGVCIDPGCEMHRTQKIGRYEN